HLGWKRSKREERRSMQAMRMRDGGAGTDSVVAAELGAEAAQRAARAVAEASRSADGAPASGPAGAERGAAAAGVDAEGWWHQQALLSRVGYWGLHAACLLVFWVGVQAGDLWLLAGTFIVRMFA